MTTYQTKPQTVEAVQWRGDNESEIIALSPEGTKFVWLADRMVLRPPHGEGLNLYLGWWVIRDAEGGVDVEDDSGFRAKYEEKP